MRCMTGQRGSSMMTLSSDAPTIMILSNLSYRNPWGRVAGSVMDHRLTISADSFVPTDGRDPDG